MSDFTDDLRRLMETGISLENKHFEIQLIVFVCDAPTRSFITLTKSHAGYFSCSKCTEEGEWHGKIVFLNGNGPLRTNHSFRYKIQDDHHLPGTTTLEQLPIDMVECFPFDYLHLVLLGVTRKLLRTWISGPLPVRLPARNINLISDFLIHVSPFIPVGFARKTRSLAELPQF